MEGHKKILVPLDGSGVSEAILPGIEKVAPSLKARISLVRVVHVHPVPYRIQRSYKWLQSERQGGTSAG